MDVNYTPSWKKYEAGIHGGDNATSQVEAVEKFTAERDNELKTNPQARRWEESRKESMYKEKPNIVKRRIKSQLEEKAKIGRDIKNFGRFDSDLVPAPGYILILPETRDEEKTESGIYLAKEASQDFTTIGEVIEVGEGDITNDGRLVKEPCQKGDRILFKKGAGIEMDIKGNKCRFMQFSDVLGRFK